MAGIPVTVADVNFRVGNLAVAIRDQLAAATTFKRWFDDHDNAALMALGMSDADATLLRTVVNDLAKLARVATAQDTQALANDFFFNARTVVGLA